MLHAQTIMTRGLRSTILLAILVATVGLAAAPASAQETIIDRSTTLNALADGQLCTDADCSDVSLHVSPGKFDESTIVCVTVTSQTADGPLSEEGCADVGSTFSMDMDTLASAELAPTAVDLKSWMCEGKTCEESTRTVTLSASWTGIGEVERYRETVGDHTGPCTTYDMIDGLLRDAEVTVAIDGASFTTTGDSNLQVLDSTTYRRTNCG